jgi:hypothetical protein
MKKSHDVKAGGTQKVTDFNALLRLLSDNDIDSIIVGGAAATADGSARSII